MGFYAGADRPGFPRTWRRGPARRYNRTDWDCTLEPRNGGSDHHALRLGFRELKGFPEACGKDVMEARTHRFTSVEDFAQRTDLEIAALPRLAEGPGGLARRCALSLAKVISMGLRSGEPL